MRRKYVVLVAAILATLLLLGAADAQATTIRVPADQATIQQAIDGASAGDTVLVAAGTYYENITLKSGVTVRGAGASATTIDGGGAGLAVVTAMGVDSASQLDGFTITNGTAGGLYLFNSSPLISNCIVSGVSGSGMVIYHRSAPTITNNIIQDNSGTNGGGLHIGDASSPVIINNLITRNVASYRGGAFYIGYSSGTIANNVISNNRANTWTHGSGGGIFTLYSGVRITNNTIVANTGTKEGGGICEYWGTNAVITNCIIWGNSPFDTYFASATYSDIGTGNVGGAGNISQDPLFVNPAADDYHLQSVSPCIDVGSNGAMSLPSTDFEGDPRILDGDGDSVAVVDMGADEFLANEPPVSDPNGPYLGAMDAAIGFDGTSSSDPDGDALSYDWDWGDTTTSADAGATPTHAYAEAGIYDVCLTVTDPAGASDSACTYVVVYDPAGGFVTGGGWITSPAGAYAADPDATGKATFGFVSKYKKGASVPTGNIEFQIRAADLHFHSIGYDWLVVTGSDNAKFKGTGTINGLGEYKFQIWAGDNDPDTFRIKIWSEDESGIETVVYDNGMNRAIGGGSIVIHK